MSYFLTTQTGFSAVPLDCLLEIFQYLENDMTSLYNCMLVNRTWCRINISLLWRRPFEYFGPESTRKYPELIRTYIACLAKSAKLGIYRAGYYIPDHKRPLFPYHEYLKELDCQKLDEAVEEWIAKFSCHPALPAKDDIENVVYKELLKLLLSRSKGLWRLRLGQYREKYDLPDIGSFPLIKCTLANLRRFEFLGEMDCLPESVLDNIYQFLSKLSFISKKLEYIDVDLKEDGESYSGEGLRKLIASQKNLSFFRYIQEKPHSVRSSKKFVNALSHNASTLRNLEFNSVPLDEQCLGPLKNFSNLECMQFAYCHEENDEERDDEKDIPTENDEILEHSSSQLKVEKLIFHKSPLLQSVALEVLRLVNTSVRELTVDSAVLNLFECIFDHCPNITYLATAISQKTVESLACLSSSKIEHLILTTSENIETKDFQQLGKSLFLSLRHLSLHFNLSVEELSSLLNECQSPLESLCLEFTITADTTDDDLNKDEYLKVVMEYAKKNDSLKEFKFFLSPKSRITKDYFDIFSKDVMTDAKLIEIKDDFDIFSKDVLADAKLLIPNISRETQDPFAYIDIESKVSL